MPKNTYITNTEIICRTLDQIQNQDNLLFSEYKTPQFWRLSDLELLYPTIFKTEIPFSWDIRKKIQEYAESTVPEFVNLTPKPIHILNTQESYNIVDRQTNTVHTKRKAANQFLTRVACEYIFRQHPGTELQQAYFMNPGKTVSEIDIAKDNIKLERARQQITDSSKILSAIVNRSRGANKNSFSEIWGTMWHTLYKVKNMDELRNGYGIKTSPLDYMSATTLIFMNNMLQNVISHFCTEPNCNVETIKSAIQNMANITRRRFIEYGSTPEAQILSKRTVSTVEKVQKERTKFWKQYYPISLQYE